MGLLTLVLASSKALGRNAQRTLLAILAVAIGIAAVIATAALGNGSAAALDQRINAVGDDFLWIRAGNRSIAGVRTGSGGARTLTMEDADALVAEAPAIRACSPRITGRAQIITATGQNWNTSFRGVTTDFFDIRRRDVVAGVPFADFDETAYDRVLVAGPALAENLFGDASAVGQTVRMDGGLYKIIGVFESKGVDIGGLDRDDAVWLPITTVHRNLERQAWIDDIMCSVVSPDRMDRAEVQATSLLRERHRLLPDEADDFEIRKPIATLEMRAQTSETLHTLLTAIGAVSLLVGGIGIMNIMLVSVAERQREIGIRLAAGARVRDIRRQFLLEAAGIGLVGGLAGIALGAGAGQFLAQYYNAEALVSAELVLLATATAVGAGLLFGYLPAYRASLLDPIQAIAAES